MKKTTSAIKRPFEQRPGSYSVIRPHERKDSCLPGYKSGNSVIYTEQYYNRKIDSPDSALEIYGAVNSGISFEFHRISSDRGRFITGQVTFKKEELLLLKDFIDRRLQQEDCK